MKIISLSLGILSANCYILIEGDNTLVIDPGGNPELIYPYLKGRKLIFIINTHGHYDHIGANNDLKAHYDTKLCIHEKDYPMMLNPQLNLSTMADTAFISVLPDILLKDEDIIEFGKHNLKIIHTPGHTEGSVCIATEDILFSGDTLFYHSVGRTDLPGGSPEKLKQSIITRLYTLNEDTLVYPGHGENTTIGEEKRFNDFVRV